MKKIISFLLLISILLLSNIFAHAEDADAIPNSENAEHQLVTVEGEELDSIILVLSNDCTNVNEVYLDTFAASYFRALKSNFGRNEHGTCSYVAAAMLLSFYDTYWDDNIIEEKYEAGSTGFNYVLSSTSDSPGVTRERSSVLSEDDYYECFIVPNSDGYFHSHLIRIARENNIYNASNPLALLSSEVKILLEYYLYEERGFDESDVTVEYTSTLENFRKFCIEKVKQGVPVFASVCALDESAHSIIIYDYNEDEDELYCHMGWDAFSTHVAFSSIKYQYFGGVVTLNFNSEHSHSNNYVDSEKNKYCSCYFSCHPEHVCTYALCEDDDSKHVYTCNCQYKSDNTGDHSLVYVTQGVNSHVQRCRLCGWTSEPSSHYWQSSSLDDYAKCKLCGYLKRLNGEFIPIIKSKKTEIQPAYAFADTE